MKFIQKLILSLTLFTACATLARAHAFPDHAEPKVGSTVTSPPTEVKIWFTKDIVKASSIAVYDAKGTEVDKKDNRIAPENASLMAVSIPTLPTGTYKVTWNAVCRDTHHTSGSFSFQVISPNH